MFKRITQILFITLFLLMMVLPLITTNFKNGKISVAEKRVLADRPILFKEDGDLNQNFATDFETWINDNIGQRSAMVISNARIMFYLFRVLANNSDMYLGPNGELNYATAEMLKDYQHLNLYSEDYLRETAASMQILNTYVENKGARFFYYQCWDKHSIYPEYFPTTVIQKDTESKTDAIVRALSNYSTVNVVSPKQVLLNEKKNHSTYSIWGDPTHWNDRGAYIGYLQLMEAINENMEVPYKVLQESDYTITVPDRGMTLFGGIHIADHIETFEINAPKASPTNEKLTLYSSDKRHRFFTNDSVDNETRLLIIGDSYFDSFIIDDIAESFHETILIWGDYLEDVKNIIDTYNADIVIIEAAERVDRTALIINGVKSMP